MDVTELRRRLFMQIGGKTELWNKATITVPSNMATAGDIYTWLTTEGVLPSFNTIFFVIRDNANMLMWAENDFIEASWLKDQSTSINVFARIRSPLNAGRYLQTRNPISNPTDVMNVYQGETFTVFYQ